MNETAKAGHDRWLALQAQMTKHPEVDWARVWAIIKELAVYQNLGSLHYTDEQEMEREGFY
jgi:hypothetical protein